ncbi:MAG: outer membrane beta-barrel protein, partial [Gammaproteobacteria bacterium]
MDMKTSAIVFAIILSLFSINAAAQNYGFYVGGSLGYTDFHQSASEIQSILASAGLSGVNATANVDDTDMGWKLFGGFHFNKYLGIEGGYADLGRTKLSLNATVNDPLISPTPVNIASTARVNVDGFTLDGVLSYPIYDRFDVFGKAGAFFWSADLKANVNVTGLGTPISDTFSNDENGTDLTFGAGMRYHFN